MTPIKATLDSRQLLAFSALARRGSFTLAAKDLFLTQSAVSHAIKALEEDVGTQLVDRLGRRVRLTAAGERLLAHVSRILREMELARGALDERSTWSHRSLRVGAGPTACQLLLPPVLRELRRRHPEAVLRLEPGDHGRQLDQLRDGLLDLALTVEPSSGALTDVAFLPLFHDELRLLVAPDHPWAALGRPPKEALEQGPLLLPGVGSRTHRLLLEHFRAEGIAPAGLVEVSGPESARGLATAGFGAAVLAPWAARPYLESGALVSLPLGTQRLRRRWGVVHPRGHPLSPAEEAFVSLCLSACESLGLRVPPAAA